MDKPLYKSMTFWGLLLLAFEVTVRWTYLGSLFYTSKIVVTLIDPLLVFFGVLLTGVGLRRLMK